MEAPWLTIMTAGEDDSRLFTWYSYVTVAWGIVKMWDTKIWEKRYNNKKEISFIQSYR
jgi:hypothetical protein